MHNDMQVDAVLCVDQRDGEAIAERSLKIEQMSSTVIELVRSYTLLDELVQITDLVELCEVIISGL